MIIIDEHASHQLIHALKTLTDMDNKQCVRFKVKGQVAPTVRQCLIDSVQTHLSAHNPHLYFCEDDDVYLIGTNLPIKETRRVMLDIAVLLKTSADTIADIYELNVQTGAILGRLEGKIEAKRKMQEALHKQAVDAQAARKRQHILFAPTLNPSQNVSARRQKRDTPEFMIIEDDPFSRRLVENVLQKQYRLTGLGSAEHALSTYVQLAPNMLLLDINLPDVTGHELLERIMALDPDAYVIMLSGNADKENVMQAMNHGAKGFIAKPFTRDKLFQYIERCPTIKYFA